MSGRELDLERSIVKVVTLKSAKGLEFPVVAIAGFLDGGLPLPRGADHDELDEALLRERRALFVGMTRAMRALLVLLPADRTSPLFAGFDDRLWNIGAA
jgi:superfamily I DNA/RNA helicase